MRHPKKLQNKSRKHLVTHLTITHLTYRYHLHNTEHSSAKFGLCRVCQQHCSEVWFQVEEQPYTPDQDEIDFVTSQGLTPEFWTTYNCNSSVGHRECLEAQQRKD